MTALRRQVDRAMTAALAEHGHHLSDRTIAILAKAVCERIIWPVMATHTTELDQARQRITELEHALDQGGGTP
jgi:hypothetical protein